MKKLTLTLLILAIPATVWGVYAVIDATGDHAIDNAAANAIRSDTAQANLLPLVIATAAAVCMALLGLLAYIALRLAAQTRQEYVTLAQQLTPPATTALIASPHYEKEPELF